MVSNQFLELFQLQEYYRLREKVEELFAGVKGSFDGKKPRVWYPDTLRGRQFAQFIGLGYQCFIMRKIREVRQKLEFKSADETEQEAKQRKKLTAWIGSHFLSQIMDWFDCIETTDVSTESVKVRWPTEMVTQDRRFLKMLGVIPE